MDVFVSCVAQALLLYRVVHRRFMFSIKELHQDLRRRRRWRYQVEQAKREDVVRKASNT
jgi:hypothetical protein